MRHSRDIKNLKISWVCSWIYRSGKISGLEDKLAQGWNSLIILKVVMTMENDRGRARFPSVEWENGNKIVTASIS